MIEVNHFDFFLDAGFALCGLCGVSSALRTPLKKRSSAPGSSSISTAGFLVEVFAMKKRFLRVDVTGTGVSELPDDIAAGIGKIIVRWAYFEAIVQDLIWQTLGLGPAEGRIAVREPKIQERLEMLCELVTNRKCRWDDVLYKSIRERAPPLAAKRHLLAHGGWIKHDGEWHVQLTRGSWPKNMAELVAGSKKVVPELVLIDAERLKAATNQIDQLIEDLKALRKSSVGPPRQLPEQSA